ncbi:transporter [Seongchinamella sediminis]|uniref:Transporter n=1 Tax=Seongchinamella sediminis TaxID=2283635 RepID=A0A3L7E0K2_9GAMM|nr:TolC family protein [Seongchinamella sediminis]RLQ22459.1 transporter [Seongchinamella sediminis]
MKSATEAVVPLVPGPGLLARRLATLVLLCAGLAVASLARGLSLEQAIALAQDSDPWIAGSQQRQSALAAERIAAGALPDPMISAGFANLPTDSFDFDQEAMTQFKVGVSQLIPRGDSRQLRQQELSSLEAQHPLRRAERRARVATEVAVAWLEAWRARETIRLIEADRDLFEQLVDVARSNYASALGQTRQQDLIRAQLELTRLDDRLVQLDEAMAVALSQLSQWLQTASALTPVSATLPAIELADTDGLLGPSPPSEQDLARRLSRHPAVLSVDRELEARRTGIALAEQQYKPQWRVNASYGYRDDDPRGPERPDFFSLGVSIDMPLFNSTAQDNQRKSAVARTEAVRTERALLLRKLVAGLQSQLARLTRLEQRDALYRSRLLEEMRYQAEASLSAYTNDDGDFAEVVRAKIAELNARIDAQNIRVDRQITLARLNYFLTVADSSEERAQ